MTPEERGDLAERLLPVAAKLACITHGDGDHHDIHHHTQRFDRTELLALVVLLAGLVDPDQLLADALGYITWDERGHAAPTPAYGRKTLRGLAKDVQGPESLGVDLIVKSERVLLARRLYLVDGLSLSAVARAVGVSDITVKQWRDTGNWRQAPTITEFDAGKRRKRAA